MHPIVRESYSVKKLFIISLFLLFYKLIIIKIKHFLSHADGSTVTM